MVWKKLCSIVLSFSIMLSSVVTTAVADGNSKVEEGLIKWDNTWTSENKKMNWLTGDALLTTAAMKGSDSSNRDIYAMEWDPNGADMGVMIGLPDGVLTGTATLEEIVESVQVQYPDRTVLAAVNGDPDTSGKGSGLGIPQGYAVSDGEILTTQNLDDYGMVGLTSGGDTIASDANGTLNSQFRMFLTSDEVDGGNTIRVNRLNELRDWGDLTLYNWRMGATYETQNADLEIVLHRESGEPQMGQAVTFSVVEVREESAAVDFSDKNTYLLSIGQDQNAQDTSGKVDKLKGLEIGDSVSIQFTTVDSNSPWTEAAFAVGGTVPLVVSATGGEYGDLWKESDYSDMTDRAAIGLRSNGVMSMVLIEQNDNSVGASLDNMTKFLKSTAGGVGSNFSYAIALGSGDQAAFAYRTDNGMTYVNEGAQLSSAVIVYTTAQASGLASLVVSPAAQTVLGGSDVTFSASGRDSSGLPVALTDPITWSADASIGTITQTGVLTTPKSAAVGSVTASVYETITGTSSIIVSIDPDTIQLDQFSIVTARGQTVELRATAKKDGQTLLSQNKAFDWSLTGDVGTVDENGVFTATDSGDAQGTLTVSYGGLSKTINVSVGTQFADSEGPTVQLLSPTPNATTNTQTPAILFAAVDESGLDEESIVLKLDGQPITATFTPGGTNIDGATADKISYTPTQSLNDGVHTVSMSVADKKGNITEITAEFMISTYDLMLYMVEQNASYVRGQNFAVDVKAASSDRLGAVSLDFSFDPSVLEITDVELGGSHMWEDQLSKKEIDNETGIISLEYNDLEWSFYGDTQNLLTIKGRVKTDAPDGNMVLSLTSGAIKRTDGNGNYVGGFTPISMKAVKGTLKSWNAAPYNIKNPYQEIDWATVNQLASATHTHSAYSGDGSISPALLVKFYQGLGYDILSLSEHNDVVNGTTKKANVNWAENSVDSKKVDAEINPLYSRLEAGLDIGSTEEKRAYLTEAQTEMISVVGSEISQGHHLNAWFTDWNSRNTGTETASFAAIEENGGISRINHPQREQDEDPYVYTRENYENWLLSYDTIIGTEAVNSGLLHDDNLPIWDKMITDVADSRNVWGFAEDDAHLINHVGKDWNVVLFNQNREDVTASDVQSAYTNGAFYFRTVSVINGEQGNFKYSALSYDQAEKADVIQEAIQNSDDPTVWAEKAQEMIAKYASERDKVPAISDIIVTEKGITITGTDIDEIVWISEGIPVAVTSSGESLAYNTMALGSYVRAELRNEYGTAYTQPFMVEDKTEVPVKPPTGNTGSSSTQPNYSNEVTPTVGGSVSVDSTTAATGTSVTLTVKPDTGKKLHHLVIVDAEGKLVPYTVQQNGTYTYEQPDSKVTISAVFMWDGPFDDVNLAWYTDAVEFAYNNGLLIGTSKNTFKPFDSMSRSQVWMMLARLDGKDTTGGKVWYSKAMAWAVETNISDGTAPGAPITREQLVTMLYRYAGYPDVDNDNMDFPDRGEISEYALKAMDWATGTGILEGNEDGLLNPQSIINRAEVAVILMRMLQNDVN